MKKVVAGLFMALDGVVESPDKCQFDSFDEDMGAEVDTLIAETDTALLGRTPGKDIAIQGSPTLVRSLLQNDLLDKLKLMIHPVVGGVKHLFEDGRAPKRLLLTDTKTTRAGVVILTYEPKDPR